MWIKICGIRDLGTALAIAPLAPDAIGLNFFSGSPRVVSPTVAAEIVARLPAGIEPVGVFVNDTLDQIREIARHCRLHTIQLHGDEPPEFVAQLTPASGGRQPSDRSILLADSKSPTGSPEPSPLRVIRAFRVGDEGLDAVSAYLDECRRLGAVPWACMIDARVEGAYGGTGKIAPWDRVRNEYRTGEWPPLILAGGLRPENVAEAIDRVSPWGVDVAGGVESAVACKDAALVREFVVRARAR